MKQQVDEMQRQGNFLADSVAAAKKSVEAALAQTQAMIDRERARIFVVPSGQVFSLYPKGSGQWVGSYIFEIRNVGPTAAINLALRYSACVSGLETAP
jgi:hypothetical protein